MQQSTGFGRDALRAQECTKYTAVNADPKYAAPVPVQHHGRTQESTQERHEEALLVRRAQAGDRAAFRILYERTFGRACAMATRVVRNRAEAEDIVQESFVRAFENLHEFSNQAAFYTWLYRIVMNRCIDSLRRKRSTTRADFSEETVPVGTDQSFDIHPKYLGSQPLETLERSQIMEILNKTLAQMSEPLRIILILREFDGLSYDEIAQSLDIPVGTVMSRLFHARKKLQEALAEFAP